MTQVQSQSGRGAFSEEAPLEDHVVKIYRCAKVVKGGRRFRFAALVIVGDRNGHVGVGYGKANEVPSAVEKGIKSARKNLAAVNRLGQTIPHRVTARYRASKVIMVPAGEGTGLGLSLSYDIVVKQHGGELTVESEPGEFTAFRVTIPRALPVDEGQH